MLAADLFRRAKSQHKDRANSTMDGLEAEAAEAGAGAGSKQLAHVLASIPASRIVYITSAGVEALPESDLVVLRAAEESGESVVALVAGEFRYPLCGQPIMRVRPGVYMLPGKEQGASYCLRAERADDAALASLEAAMAAFAVLRDRKTGWLVQPGGGAADPEAGVAASGAADGEATAAEDGAERAREAAESGPASWSAFMTGVMAGASGAIVPAGAAAPSADFRAGGAEAAGGRGAPGSSVLRRAAGAVTTGAGRMWGAARAAAHATNSEHLARFPRPEGGGAGAAPEGGAAAASEGDAWRRTEGAVVSAGRWAASGLVVGSRCVGSGVRAAGRAVASRVPEYDASKRGGGAEAAAEAGDGVVSPGALRGIRRARMVSSTAVLVTRGMVVTMTELAKGMGTAIGTVVGESAAGRKMSAKLASSGTARGLRRVGLASLVALGDVWDGLEEGLCTLGGDVMEATEGVVGKRYGDEAAAATREGMLVVGDAGVTVMQLGRTGPAGLILGASKTAAQRAVLGDEQARLLAQRERERRLAV